MWSPTMHGACSAEPECRALRCCFRPSALVWHMVVVVTVAAQWSPWVTLRRGSDGARALIGHCVCGCADAVPSPTPGSGNDATRSGVLGASCISVRFASKCTPRPNLACASIDGCVQRGFAKARIRVDATAGRSRGARGRAAEWSCRSARRAVYGELESSREDCAARGEAAAAEGAGAGGRGSQAYASNRVAHARRTRGARSWSGRSCWRKWSVARLLLRICDPGSRRR